MIQFKEGITSVGAARVRWRRRDVAGFHEIPRGKLFFYEEQPAVLAAHIARFVGV